MQRWRQIIHEKVLPQIRKKKSIDSYQVFRMFKKLLMPSKNINESNYFANKLDYNNDEHLKFISIVLKKKMQNRSQIELSSIFNCFKDMKYFKDLMKETSVDVVKSIIKHSKIIKLNKNNLVFNQQDEVLSYYIVLKGKIGILADTYRHYVNQKIQKNLANFIQNLLIYQLKEQVRNKNLFSKKNSSITNKIKIKKYVQLDIEDLDIKEVIFPGHSFGDQIHQLGDTHKNSAVALENTYILQFRSDLFLRTLKYHNDKKLEMQAQFFRKFRCFDLLQQDELYWLIQTTEIQEKAKNEYIFKTGQQSKSFYLLLQGEVRLTKLAKLFTQNPNKLYMNRLENKKEKNNLLPYANFQKLYNYTPKQQTVELAILSKQNMFGEQQTFLKQRRQTNAKVCSPMAKYYVIYINVLEQILKQKKHDIEHFKQFLFGISTEKKILYRQKKFSQILNFKNKNKFDYFYIQKEEKQSPKKLVLQKINNKMINKTLEITRGLDQIPYYTTFNFNKLINVQNSSKSNNFNNQTQPSPQEQRLIQKTHVAKLMEYKLNNQQILYQIKNPKKRSINLTNPLFEATYFSKLHKQTKKLEQEQKKKRFSIKIKSKSINLRK